MSGEGRLRSARTISIADTDATLKRLDALARLMDSSFVFPGTGIRFGLDAVIGLVPVIGDLVSQVISSYIIWEARRLGVSRWIMARMIGNSLIDTVIGIVPVAGDAFDVLFRANIKNVALLRRYLERHGAGGKIIEGEAVRIG